MSAGRPAVVVVTDLVVLCRHLDLVAEIRGRDLEPVLVFGPETPAAELAARRADPAHPLSSVTEVVHVPDYGLDTLLGAVVGLGDRLDVRGIVSCGELFVDAAGALAQALGLPGPGGQAARVARNKLLQRLTAPSLAPRWRLVGPDRRVEWDEFPAVLKPIGRMSSSGVLEVGSRAELDAALAATPGDELLLVEERVRGPEYSVEALVHDGEVVWAGVTAKRTNESGTAFFTEMGHTSPAGGLDARQEDLLLDANAVLLDALGFGSGMSHAEFRLDGGRVVLMEVAARPPGDAITKLWLLSSGAPLEPALLDLALGVRPKPPARLRRAQQVYLDHPRGVLRDVRCDAAEVSWITDDGRWPGFAPAQPDAPARLCAVVVTRRRGDVLGEVADSGGRSVSVVVDCPLGEDVDEVGARFAGTVSFVVEEVAS
ncbi:ATP-grasp domain-containing protein [Saccharothrix saharensis]|uniref:ATP-grasp domain-containing protein n=1 Tax=Saccharothrix saharensis TaxID=571190 RepID=A0A543JR90_9PSEU|nr:ATP-grasp domain-containing protein [Saccharothrix saharensis]TQM85362.1 ATP-grasp domain-containing protein [Saccharothrix saharensis]